MDFDFVIPAKNMNSVAWLFVKDLFYQQNDGTYAEGHYEVLPRGTTLWDILVKIKFFPSKNIARKQWAYGPLEPGFNDFEDCGKLRHRLSIMNFPEYLDSSWYEEKEIVPWNINPIPPEKQ